ncbi:hypothetical protein ACLB2K_012930 [Fragaria x ananassa]
MVGPTPTSDSGLSTLIEDRVRQIIAPAMDAHLAATVEGLKAHTDQATLQLKKEFDSLNSKVDTIQQSVTDLVEQVKRDRVLVGP